MIHDEKKNAKPSDKSSQKLKEWAQLTVQDSKKPGRGGTRAKTTASGPPPSMSAYMNRRGPQIIIETNKRNRGSPKVIIEQQQPKRQSPSGATENPSSSSE
jgi:hypothetical protein